MNERRIARGFALRMAPAAATVGLVVALAPPLLYRDVEVRRLGEQATVYASHIAGRLRAVAARQPRLWRYNAHKVIGAAASHRAHPDIAAVRVTDCEGATLFAPSDLGVGSGATGGPGGWAPVPGGSGPVAWVQVRMDPGAYLPALGTLWGASGLVGLLLAALVFLYPTRVVRRQALRLDDGRSVVGIQEAERGATAASAALASAKPGCGAR